MDFLKITTRSFSHLAKHKVVRSEDPPHSAGLDAVHGAGLQVPEDGSRYLEFVTENQKLSDSSEFPPMTVWFVFRAHFKVPMVSNQLKCVYKNVLELWLSMLSGLLQLYDLNLLLSLKWASTTPCIFSHIIRFPRVHLVSLGDGRAPIHVESLRLINEWIIN